jgi:glutamate synthase (NADPH) large chain
VIGRTDLLAQISRGAEELDDLDLNPLLVQADPGNFPRSSTREGRNEVPDTLDAQIVEDAKPLFTNREKMELSYEVRNVHRAVGTRLSGLITRSFGQNALPAGHITIQLHGSAGQSLGAFAVQGVKLKIFGDANDYVGKGLSGATIVVRPPVNSALAAHDNTIIGNTVLYGATAGRLFAAGQAGERFAVRNSGAFTVIEGCGSNGCEYMTGGVAVVLGHVGPNFAAGMTGGMAYVYDPDNILAVNLNADHVLCQTVDVLHYQDQLKALITEHLQETGSARARAILDSWETSRKSFRQIIPREILSRLEISPLAQDREEKRA